MCWAVRNCIKYQRHPGQNTTMNDVILWKSKKLTMAFKVSKEAGDHRHVFNGQKLL